MSPEGLSRDSGFPGIFTVSKALYMFSGMKLPGLSSDVGELIIEGENLSSSRSLLS